MANKQAFGGDDDSGGNQQPQQAKKLDLKKYASKPDMNIRDIFWDIMANYAMKKKISREELNALQHERIPLIRIALNVIENPQSAYFGLSRNLTALYSLMMILDAGWEDAFEQLVVKSYEHKQKLVAQVSAALNKALEEENYKNAIVASFKKMIRNSDSVQAVLAYLSKVENKELLDAVKKEAIIVARSDIEKNQHYAMSVLAKIIDDECKGILIGLITHWDPETREMAIKLLKKEKDHRITDVAKRQLAIETEPGIKKALSRIVNEGEKLQ